MGGRLCMQHMHMGGAWLPTEFDLHINVKEMIAIYYGLRSFLEHIQGLHIRVLSDNTTAVSVVNNMGTTAQSAIKWHKTYGSFVNPMIFGLPVPIFLVSKILNLILNPGGHIGRLNGCYAETLS